MHSMSAASKRSRRRCKRALCWNLRKATCSQVLLADIRVRAQLTCVGVDGRWRRTGFQAALSPSMLKDIGPPARMAGRARGGCTSGSLLEGAWIVNFPTKRDWRCYPSRYEDIHAGLEIFAPILSSKGRSPSRCLRWDADTAVTRLGPGLRHDPEQGRPLGRARVGIGTISIAAGGSSANEVPTGTTSSQAPRSSAIVLVEPGGVPALRLHS